MNRKLHALIVEDSDNDALLLGRLLLQGGFDVHSERVETAVAFVSALDSREWDIILCDYMMPEFNGLEALRIVKAHGMDVPFIFFSGVMGEEIAIEAMRAGAHDYVMKANPLRLVPAIERELHEAASRKESKRVEESLISSELRYRRLFEAAKDGILILDAETGKIVDANPFVIEMLGCSPDGVLGKTIPELGLFDDSIVTTDTFLQRKEPNSARYEDIPLQTRDGRRMDVEFVSSVYETDHRKLIQCSIRDTTERKRSERALSDSERKFRILFDEAPIGYHELDTRGRIVEVNRTELDMLGYSPAEMLQHPAWDFFVEGTASRTSIERQLAGSTPAVHSVERTFRRKDRTTVNVLISNRTLFNDSGVIVGIRSTLQDITPWKKAESDLRLMGQTVASVRDCISITDLDNRFIFVNEAFRKTYGYATEELLGKDVAMLRSPNAPPTMTTTIFDGTIGGGWHGEVLNRTKDGSDFPVELWTSVVKDDAGTPVAMVGVARDITGRKAAEELLRRNDEQFRLIAENIAEMIAVIDLDGRRVYNSPSYRNILGNPESLKSTDSLQDVHPEDREAVKRVFQETVRTGIGQRLEYRFLLKDGSVRIIDSKGSVIRDKNGKVSQVIVVSRDVTEEKRLAAQFLRAQRMESIGTLAGGIAHDLNNVLSPILMSIEILRGRIPDPAALKILSTIETSAKRGADIVRQVLAFGRGVEGERILVQLKHVITEVVKIAGGTFPKSITITTDLPRDLWTVSADPTQMHQVLLNILVNARDAMPDGGTLTIAAENVTLDEHYARMHLEAKSGTYVSLAITDTGMGIPVEIREKIFEPFFTTKEIGLGTGLGLSITLAIVKSHGGFFQLESEVGKGTTFRLYLPATGEATHAKAAAKDMDLPTGNGELILVIDDEAAIREITKETLEAYGYRTLTAGDGAEGVAVFAENKETVKAVITDMMMPVMDGTAAILALKKIRPDVKIIAVSGLGSTVKNRPPPRSSIQAFLTKPYTAEILLTTLATALR